MCSSNSKPPPSRRRKPSLPPNSPLQQRPDGSFYVKGPRNVIFGYEEGDPDPNMPAWTGLCVFCGDDDHDVYHCPILDAQENPDAFLIEDWEK